jgi:hypothetical protein
LTFSIPIIIVHNEFMSISALLGQLNDRALPTENRIEAAQTLAKQHPEDATGEALADVLHDFSDDPALRAAAAEALARWNGYGCIPHLVRPLHPFEVRAAAIAALDSLDALDGEMESNMSADLQRVLSGPHNAVLTTSLPRKYGRDPRLLGNLEQMLEHESDLYRADAVTALVTLGEMDAALAAIEDEAPLVRYRLLEALRDYPDEGADEAIESLTADEDPNVARLAQEILAQLRGEEFELDWESLLPAFGTPAEPATEEAIAAKEAELGQTLPASYRGFLLQSNGIVPANEILEALSPVENIEWLAARNGDWIGQFQTEDDVTPEEHLFQPDQPETYRAAYLKDCLLISDPGEKVVTLLNPQVQDESGEWEAWFFGPTTIGGAVRYPSFAALIESQCNETGADA